MSAEAVIPIHATSYILVEMEVWKTQTIAQRSTEQIGKKSSLKLNIKLYICLRGLAREDP